MKKDKKKIKSKKINLKAILLVVLCTVFTSLGQIFWKIGTKNLELNLMSIIINIPFILGFVFYGLGLILLISALKFGDLSFLYPFIALSFVWVGLLSHFFLEETLNLLKIVAIIIIITGVAIIGLGGHHEN